MRPRGYDDDFIIIDSALDHPIFPTEVHQGIDVLAPGVFDPYDFDDGYADFSDLEYQERRNHWLFR